MLFFSTLALVVGLIVATSECRGLANVIGDAVATMVVSRREGRLDRERFDLALAGGAARVDQRPAGAVAAE